jgi:6-pyruvoyltetrahydropterin/6-carboxytetrahydropterin synthase
MKNFQSTKLVDGFSTCYRNWKSTGKDKYLHGSALSFRVRFEGELDERNWVADFGLFKRAKTTIDGKSPKDYFAWLLDHTTVIDENDPYLEIFKQMDRDGIIQLRILPFTGCKGFAEFIYNKINDFLLVETEGRVKVVEVEVYENN